MLSMEKEIIKIDRSMATYPRTADYAQTFELSTERLFIRNSR